MNWRQPDLVPSILDNIWCNPERTECLGSQPIRYRMPHPSRVIHISVVLTRTGRPIFLVLHQPACWVLRAIPQWGFRMPWLVVESSLDTKRRVIAIYRAGYRNRIHQPYHEHRVPSYPRIFLSQLILRCSCDSSVHFNTITMYSSVSSCTYNYHSVVGYQ